MGIALDVVNSRIFYTLTDNSIMRVNFDGTNLVDLTGVIGVPTHFTHQIFDIDYEADTNKIYWLENANPNPGFGISPPPGKLRRANPDGTGVEDVISDIGYRATLVSFQYGTLKPRLLSPDRNTTYIEEFPFAYLLAEPEQTDSIKVNFKQGNSILASLTMSSDASGEITIAPFSNDLNSNQFITAATGFPISEGNYTIEISYKDAVGNSAASAQAENVTLVLPTPTSTPTATQTATNTNTPTVTATATNTPTASVTPDFSNTPPVVTPQATPDHKIDPSKPTATPAATATIETPQCISSLRQQKLKIESNKATLSINAKKGSKYVFSTKPIGSPKRKAINQSVTALKNGALNFSFNKLKNGLWEFSYSTKIKKVVTKSCPQQKLIS